MRGDDVDQAAFNILAHPFGIAADINIGALGEPGPYFAADLAHAILHIEFLVAVPRPSQRQSRQQARSLQGIEFVAVEKIATAALMAEEQPVLAWRAGRLAVEQERTERRDAGARPDHDDWHLRILRQREAMGLLHIDLDRIAGLEAFGEECRSQSKALALADHITHAINRQRQLSRRGIVRRRDRIKSGW